MPVRGRHADHVAAAVRRRGAGEQLPRLYEVLKQRVAGSSWLVRLSCCRLCDSIAPMDSVFTSQVRVIAWKERIEPDGVAGD